MELTHLFVVHLLAVLSVHVLLVRGNDHGLGVTEEAITEEQQKVYDECRNPDYKKYVKCLMRSKRHYTNHGDVMHDDTTNCLESCLKKFCEHQMEHDCEKKCSHCTKRTKHRHQIITEYETECVSGNCSPSDGLKTTNITTNIDIHNIINTYDNCNITCPSGTTCVNGTCVTIVKRVEIPTLPIIPQISLVPQITYAYTGCMYSQWLCAEVQQPDCSGCGNPLLRYKCDVKCYATNTNVTHN